MARQVTGSDVSELILRKRKLLLYGDLGLEICPSIRTYRLVEVALVYVCWDIYREHNSGHVKPQQASDLTQLCLSLLHALKFRWLTLWLNNCQTIVAFHPGIRRLIVYWILKSPSKVTVIGEDTLRTDMLWATSITKPARRLSRTRYTPKNTLYASSHYVAYLLRESLPLDPMCILYSKT